MLALGIPGSPTAAVLLGGLLIWGLQPGPLLFVEQKDFVWGLIASMYLGNIAGLIIVLTCVPLFAAILRVPFSIIAPIIVVICAIGAYTVHNAMLDIWFMLLFGVDRLRLQEALVSARAARARARARRPRGSRFPPGDAALAGRPADLLLELARRAASWRSRSCCCSGRSTPAIATARASPRPHSLGRAVAQRSVTTAIRVAPSTSSGTCDRCRAVPAAGRRSNVGCACAPPPILPRRLRRRASRARG